LAILALCVLAEAVVLPVGIDDLDEGYFAQHGTRILHGEVPYRDFESLYTPGLDYVHAALFGALGGPYLLAPRVLSLLFRAGVVVMLYVLTRRVVANPVLAALPGVFLLLGFDAAPDRWEPHPGWPSTFFALVAVWAAVHPLTRGWLILAGAAAALTFAFKQNAGVFILLALAIRTLPHWRAPGTRPKSSIAASDFGPAFLAPISRQKFGRQAGSSAISQSAELLAIMSAAFAVTTAFWLVPLLIAIDGRLDLLRPFVGAVNQAGLFSPPEPIVIIPILCLVGGVALARSSRDPTLRWYVLAGAALFLTQFPRSDAVHLAWSAPLLLVLGTLALTRVRPLAATVLVLWAAVLCLPVLEYRARTIDQATTTIVGIPFATGLRVPAGSWSDLLNTIAEVQHRTATGAPILVYPSSPLLYTLADRRNPTRFDHLNPGAADRGQIAQVIADAERAGVQLAVVSDFWRAAWGPPGDNAALEDWLFGNFREVAHFGAYRVFVRQQASL